MMESTSSCTNLSGSKLNFFTAHGTIACRTDAPGMSWCFASHASSRPAIPSEAGMPPTPGGRSSTRLLSVIANCPSRKNASRGSVATQFGLPRPAFRYERDDSSADFDATLARKSLISNGPSFSYFWSVNSSMDSPRGLVDETRALGKHQNYDQAPQREQRVADRVGHCIAEHRNVAIG